MGIIAKLEYKRRHPRIRTGSDHQKGDADLHYNHSFVHMQHKHPTLSQEAGDKLTNKDFTYCHQAEPYTNGIIVGLREARKGIKDGLGKRPKQPSFFAD